MGVNGTLVEAELCTFTLNIRIVSSSSVPFTLTTVQVPNLTLTVPLNDWNLRGEKNLKSFLER